MKKKKTIFLVALLILVVLGGVLFIGAVSGWFNGTPKVTLDSQDVCGESCERTFTDLEINDYEQKIANGDSFVLFVDQEGCHTADRIREFLLNWAMDTGARTYRMMFSDVRECSAHDYVKYYPSVVVVSKGKPLVWLRADEEEDSDAYNFEDKFREWISRYF